ncbi:DUF2490 domain-containing protein [Flavobacteriaceae bacterium D16]|nr:DUF2490 domain-containing protein [Flavobacteriaceae bacterium D16]
MRKIWILIALITLTGMNAQETGEDTWGSWFQYFGMNKISDKWSIHTEAQFRYYETTSNFNQMLLRTGANFHLADNAIVTLGYGYIDTDPSFEELNSINEISEHRIFQQFLLYNKVWEFKIEHRYRLEQRFIDYGSIRGEETQHRARYRLQLTLPLTDTFFLNFYDEIFINFQDNLFDQNRAYAALGVHLTENSSIQIGYLKNTFSNTSFDRLQFAIFYNPDLRSLFKK